MKVKGPKAIKSESEDLVKEIKIPPLGGGGIVLSETNDEANASSDDADEVAVTGVVSAFSLAFLSVLG